MRNYISQVYCISKGTAFDREKRAVSGYGGINSTYLGKDCTTDEDCPTFHECSEEFSKCVFNWDWKPILLIGLAVIVVIGGMCVCIFCLPCCAVAGCVGCCC